MDKKNREKHSSKGFTLIEILVVIAILALLAAIATPQVMKHLGRAKTQTAKIEINNIGSALDLYRIDLGRYPSAEEGLAALLAKPAGVEAWKGPYLKKKNSLSDPWGYAYIYRIPGQHGDYDLLSYGADKAEGGSGEAEDVTNW
jgi:general secretion pathway protein G